MLQGKIHSVESFGTVDGPGIRFIVFMQGCPLRCLYCHNPDTWSMHSETLMSISEILNQYKRNEQFYRDGGITCTGGEPLLQIDFLIELFREAKKLGIHTCLDTSGICFTRLQIDKYKQLASVCDLVLLDIKHIDEEIHHKLTGSSNKNIQEFLAFLDEENVPVWIRHVYIDEQFNSKEMLRKLGQFIGQYRNVKAVDVLPYHTMGKNKYEKLNIEYPLQGYKDVNIETAKSARNEILRGIKDIRTTKNK